MNPRPRMAVVGARARMRPVRAQRSGSIGRTLAAASASCEIGVSSVLLPPSHQFLTSSQDGLLSTRFLPLLEGYGSAMTDRSGRKLRPRQFDPARNIRPEQSPCSGPRASAPLRLRSGSKIGRVIVRHNQQKLQGKALEVNENSEEDQEPARSPPPLLRS